ncbi:nuclear transport factor 2 family protein [Roseibium sp. SCP14]|uniref:nuclear transport factor 2 family protein n=1 Tax=Roseibium sp. SCP14 TaxID=3141375 RepID=UPI003336B366
MADRDEIAKLINHYSFTLDSGDMEGFAELFAKGEWGIEGDMHKGKDAIMNNVLSKVILREDGTPKTRHASTNVDIYVDEAAGTATCKRYGIVVQQTEDVPLQTIFSGDYYDEFIKENGDWRFVKCEIKRPFVGDLSQLFTGAF